MKLTQLDRELQQELKRAKAGVQREYKNPTDVQIYRRFLNNFDARLPFDSYWREAELEVNLDAELRSTSMFSGSAMFSEKLLSAICRNFFLEVGDAAKAARVPSDLIDITSYEDAYEKHKTVRMNFVPELYRAYVVLRKKGYNHVDLIA